MTSKRCKTCNGTGKESCEVHGQHTCNNCHGKGCINNITIVREPIYTVPNTVPCRLPGFRPNRKWELTC